MSYVLNSDKTIIVAVISSKIIWIIVVVQMYAVLPDQISHFTTTHKYLSTRPAKFSLRPLVAPSSIYCNTFAHYIACNVDIRCDHS